MSVSILWQFNSNGGVLAPPWSDYNFLSWGAGASMERHGHDFLQVIHVIDGSLETDWGDGFKIMKAGDVHILPPGFRHRLRTDGGHGQFGVNFMAQPDERGQLKALLEVFRRPTIIHMPFRQIWERVLLRPASTSAGHFRVIGTLDDYALALLEHGGESSSSLEPLVDFLKAHLRQAFSVEEISASMNTSRASLQRLCKKHFNCGIAHLHERLRMESAAQQLLLTDLRISECAEVNGYRDVYHFSRAFKRVFGRPPSAYRREKRRDLS